MSLVREYSSGEEEGPASPTDDAFGLASLPATKKQRVEAREPMSVIAHSAPDVLSEVRNVLNPPQLEYSKVS
jgi:pre-mRNA-processing factor 17